MRIALVVVDSLRADAVGYAGGERRTPTLDGMAAEGAYFRYAYSSAPWTVPSIASMMTGVYAHGLGLYRWDQPWPGEHTNVFRELSAAGYRVASFVFDLMHLFRAVPEAGVCGTSQDLDGVIEWVERATDRDLFVFIHYWGTHFPYLDRPMTTGQWKEMSDRIIEAVNADPHAMRRKVRGLYRRAVERMSERFLPRLVSALLRGTGDAGALLVLTSDHGETWGERLPPRQPIRDVFDFHGNGLYEEVLRVPLVFWGLSRLARGCLQGLARIVDLGPTLLDIALEESRLTGDGRTLAPNLRTGDPVSTVSACAAASADFVDATVGPSSPEDLWSQLALRTGRWKYLWSPRTGPEMVYDLASDPEETHPLPAHGREPAKGWDELGAQWEHARAAPMPDGVSSRLGPLGYLD